VPISISRFRSNGIDLTIRAVGATSTALDNLHPGARVGLRGPLGTFWPIEEAYGRHAVVVAGGVGLSPLHGLVDALVANHDRFESVSLFYGTRTPEDGSSATTWRPGPPARPSTSRSPSTAPVPSGRAASAS
jgi:anaerobic sulfite reductase subunit B